jgi:hypothetical protein
METNVTRIPRAAVAGALALATTAAAADDRCYDHNGSIVRYTLTGNGFVVTYDRPRPVLREAGVRPGTLLIDGTFRAHAVTATARRFSKHCPGTPLTYTVSGWFEGENPSFELEGRYPVHERCRPTGRSKYEVLRFRYVGEC